MGLVVHIVYSVGFAAPQDLTGLAIHRMYTIGLATSEDLISLAIHMVYTSGFAAPESVTGHAIPVDLLVLKSTRPILSIRCIPSDSLLLTISRAMQNRLICCSSRSHGQWYTSGFAAPEDLVCLVVHKVYSIGFATPENLTGRDLPLD